MSKKWFFRHFSDPGTASGRGGPLFSVFSKFSKFARNDDFGTLLAPCLVQSRGQVRHPLRYTVIFDVFCRFGKNVERGLPALGPAPVIYGFC